MSPVITKIHPDEAVKAVYRQTKRALRQNRSRSTLVELQARLEFLERIYRF